jgi:hypothetical protein
MSVAYLCQPVVAFQSIRHNVAATLDQLIDRAKKGVCCGVWDDLEPDSSNGIATDFSGNENQSLARRSTTTFTGPHATNESLINFHLPGQFGTTWQYHGPPHPVQPFPCCVVAAEAHRPLDTQSTNSVLLLADVPSNFKPCLQGKSGSMEESSCRETLPVPTILTFPQGLCRDPCFRMVTTVTVEAIWPAHCGDISEAVIFSRKHAIKVSPGNRISYRF